MEMTGHMGSAGRRSRSYQSAAVLTTSICSRQVIAFGSIGVSNARAFSQFDRAVATIAAPSVGEQNNEQQQPEQGEFSTAISTALEAKYDTGRNSDYRFASPLLEFGYPPAVQEFEAGLHVEKPLLLYIPGFDATYLSAFFQYPELHSLFEIRCLVSSMDDRSTFDDLKQAILKFLVERTEQLDSISCKREPTNGILPHSTDNTNKVAAQKGNKQTQFFPSNIFANLWNRKNDNGDASNGSERSSMSPKKKRQVYLAGESFGGILALEVALSLLEDDSNGADVNLQGVVLVNAATCFDRSRLAAEGPPVATLPPMLYVFGILKLLPMFLDKISLPQFWLIIQGIALPSLIDNPMREAYMGRLAFTLPSLLKFMPQETFQWRLKQWLSVGCKRVDKKLASLSRKQESLRTLILAGENDLALPSIAEAERLAQVFSQKSHVHVVKAVGHANTCGTCLDLAAEMRSHFPELNMPVRRQSQMRKPNSSSNNAKATKQDEDTRQSRGRTQMKPVAAKGNGIYFGMEPRYDGKRIGLSPLSYWSREYYQSVEGHSPR
jgi:pimeloyl-ACP methyl ester carboxylesterase